TTSVRVVYTVACSRSYLYFLHPFSSFFFFNAPPPTAIYTLSLHDALPISWPNCGAESFRDAGFLPAPGHPAVLRPRGWQRGRVRSEEHTSELQSHLNLVCRLLLEKKKRNSLT